MTTGGVGRYKSICTVLRCATEFSSARSSESIVPVGDRRLQRREMSGVDCS